jgi:predicted AAA+ superfamily ATPase
MIKRIIQKEIEKSLKTFPVVGILGSRQVGKTTLAKEIQKKISSSLYLDLELPSDFNKLTEPELFLSEQRNKLIIIDEIQQKPELFSVIRALVDQDRKNGRFLILGSSLPNLLKQSAESLAGRIIFHNLPTFLITELEEDKKLIDRLWIRGGFPDSFLAHKEETSINWRESFIKTFLERDIPNFGIKIPSIQLRRFWMMLAHSHGSLWNASKIAVALGVSPPTAKYYLDILEETFIVRQLFPFYPNVKKRIVKSPKVYLRDSGLLHTLFNIESREELLGHPIAGHSWEGFVIEQIINILSKKFNPYFYRTSAGAEVDLVAVKGDKPVLCIEVKLSLSPLPSQGFFNAMDDLNCKEGLIVYPGDDLYSIKHNVKVIPFLKLADYLTG